MSNNTNVEKNKNSKKFDIIHLLDNSQKICFIILIILGAISLSIRLYFFPNDLPFMGDALGYFWYANDISILGYFPEGHISPTVTSPPPNNGWSGFLSIIFSFMDSRDFLDYVNIQRLTTIIISTVTIFPAYLLSKKFMSNSFAIISAAAFVFAPRLMENSLLGVTEPLFLLLGILSMNLFLSERKNFIILSFVVAGLFSIVRYEGLLILIPFTIMYFVRFQKKKSTIIRYGLAMALFLLIILPMVAIRIETTGSDGLTSHIVHGPIYYAEMMDEEGDSILFDFISKGSSNLIKYLVIVSIPIFAIFIPYGLFDLFKNRDFKKWTMIIFGVVFLIPAFYAYSRGFEDTRYLFILYPIMCLMVGYTIKRLEQKIRKPRISFYFPLAGIIFFSVLFASITINDFENDKEMYEISKDIHKLTKTINREYEGLMYLKWTGNNITNHFPTLHSELYDGNVKKIKYIGTEDKNFHDIETYLEYGKLQGLTHLVLNENNMGIKIFHEVFVNENKYPFLEKIYDSSEVGFKTKVKIFEINYNTFENEN